MFGKESAGIPEEILLENQETAIRIPMIGDIRSLNLRQFRCHRPLRGPAAESLRSHAVRRTSDKISVEINKGDCPMKQKPEYLYILLLSLRSFEPVVSKLYSTNSHKMYKYSWYNVS